MNLTRENSKVVLDSFVTTNSTLIYDQIKQGTDYAEILDGGEYIERLCDFCTFEKDGDMLYSYNSDGSLRLRMTEPTILFKQENTLKVRFEYTISVPINFAGKTVSYAHIPITVTSSLTEKFL